VALPTDFSARIARNTQIVLQEETGITNVVDPWGGSFMMEKLTQQIADRAEELMAEVESLGGMAKAIERGVPKLRIEESAAAKQARIDRGEDVIVGVNKYKLKADQEEKLDILEIDNQAVRVSQIKRINDIKAKRDQKAVDAALTALTDYAKTGTGNGLDLAVKAARVRATVGEITEALEKVWGRYQAQSQTVSGVYGSAYDGDMNWKTIQTDIEAFVKLHGRRP